MVGLFVDFLGLCKLADGNGYLILHNRILKGSSMLVMGDNGLSNKARCKLILYRRNLSDMVRSWDLQLPENMSIYLMEESSQIYCYPDVDSPSKDIHVFEMDKSFGLKKLGILQMENKEKASVGIE